MGVLVGMSVEIVVVFVVIPVLVVIMVVRVIVVVLIVIVMIVVIRVFLEVVLVFVRDGFGAGGGFGGGGEEAFEAGLFLGFLEGAFLFVDEVGEPDADLVENDHGHGEEAEGEGVGGGGDDGGDDEDGEDGVGAGLLHHLVVHDAEFDEGHDDDGEFEGEAEDEGELGGEGDVVADPPFVADAHFRGVVVEELEDAGENAVVGEEDPAEEEAEADGHGGEEGAAFLFVEAGEGELEEEEEEEGEGDDDAGEEGELDGEHEALGGVEGLHEVEAAPGIDVGLGHALEESVDLFAHLLVEVGEGVDEGVAAFHLRDGEGGAEVDDGADVELEILALFGDGRVEGLAFLGSEEAGVPGGLHGDVPGGGVEADSEVLEGVVLAAFVEIGDGLRDDVHQLVPAHEAGDGGHEQDEGHAGDGDPEILEVFEEGFFVVRIGLVAELKDFREEEHAGGGRCLIGDGAVVEGDSGPILGG